MIIWGQRLYGRVFILPGVFYVATQFFHIWYLPLIPTQSWLIFEGSENNGFNQTSWRGHKISMNPRSVVFGWLRAMALVGGVFAGIFGFIAVSDHDNGGWAGIAAAVGGVVTFLLTKRYDKATPDSARAMIDKSGLPQDVQEHLLSLCGKGSGGLQDLPDTAT